jgi:hypothetical protein
MRIRWACYLFLLLGAPSVRAKGETPAAEQLAPKIVRREHQIAKDLERFHPIVETYLQVKKLQKGESRLWYDRHFISLAEFAGGLRAERFKSRHMAVWRSVEEYSESLSPVSLEYDPSGFVAMAYPEPSTFDLEHYRFDYLTAEFLGDVRCLVFQVTPASFRKGGLFDGRIWVEDRELTIIRFNGVYRGSNMTGKYFHFDSWRVNTGRNRWVPAVIYSGEAGLPCCGFWKLNWTKIRFQARTDFWGYDLHPPGSNQELSKIVVDPSSSVRDDSFGDVRGPIDQLHTWEREGEENLSSQLEGIGLISPAGDVEETLRTIVKNIEATNKISLEPEIRCRVLLTSNLESAVIGHTIILSRGLIDVLPDEATVAAVLAHDLAHVVIDGYTDTRFSWANETMFGPKDIQRKLRFVHTRKQEEQASSLATEWMLSSPYKDSLGSVTRFAEELHSDSHHIGRLLAGNIGESVYDTVDAGKLPTEDTAPNSRTGIRALPLGSRISIDPWTSKVVFRIAPQIRIDSQKNNRPFEITSISPYLRLVETDSESETTSAKN